MIDLSGKIDNDLSNLKVGENGVTAENIAIRKADLKNHDNYFYNASVKCKIDNFEPVNKDEIKNYQCMEAQKCLSQASTLGELKKLETFRNTMCGSSDSITSIGDGRRDTKINSVPTSTINSGTQAISK